MKMYTSPTNTGTQRQTLELPKHLDFADMETQPQKLQPKTWKVTCPGCQ